MGGSSSHLEFFLENRSPIALIFWGSISLCILIVHTLFMSIQLFIRTILCNMHIIYVRVTIQGINK